MKSLNKEVNKCRKSQWGELYNIVVLDRVPGFQSKYLTDLGISLELT